jgi:hypothetical protein
MGGTAAHAEEDHTLRPPGEMRRFWREGIGHRAEASLCQSGKGDPSKTTGKIPQEIAPGEERGDVSAGVGVVVHES